MQRRVLLAAILSACVAIAGGVAAWRGHVDALGALLDTQAQTAQRLLQSAAVRSDPAGVVAALGRGDVNVLLLDRSSGQRYAWRDGGPIVERGRDREPPGLPMPPPGMPMPGMPPPEGPPFVPPPRGATRFGGALAEFVRIRPRRVAAGDFELILAPSPQALTHWLLADALVCGAVLIAIGIAAWAISTALARAALVPLRRTTAALEALAAADFTPQRIEAGDAPEIARLAQAYNAAALTVAHSIEERQAAAAEFRRFLADAGHELRTPLTIVGGYLEVLARALGDGDATARRAIAGMTAETGRMRGLVEKMLLLSRLESTVAAPRVVAVREAGEEVAETMRAAFPQRVVTVRCGDEARVAIDEDDLYEALRNLVENALRYAPDSPVEISAEVRGTEVLVAVIDRGPGIAPEERALIFERFYRGKDRAGAEGSGLGLAIVARVVERWGGRIELESQPGETRFVLRFPLAERQA